MQDYENSKGYKKLPKAAQLVIDLFVKRGRTGQLIAGIKANVATQHTANSKIVRTAQFVGLLRKPPFNMSDADLKPIQVTDEQYKAYAKGLKKNFDTKQHESVIGLGLFNELLNINDLSWLLITSGRRIGELLDPNGVKLDDGVVQVKLSKRRDGGDTTDKYYPIYVLNADAQAWYTKWEQFIKGDTKNAALYLNRKLKNIVPVEFYKTSTHLLRGIYARYIYEFRNPQKRTLSQVISNALDHQSASSSGHYMHVSFSDDMVDVFAPTVDYTKLKVPELKAAAKAKGLRGYSKLKKAEIIQLLSA